MGPWLWYFGIYSFLGWLVELAFAAATRSEERRRRCLLFLPLCPVYGLGMLAALALPPMGWLGLTVFGGLRRRRWSMPTTGPGSGSWASGFGTTLMSLEISKAGSAFPLPWPGACWCGRRYVSSIRGRRRWRRLSLRRQRMPSCWFLLGIWPAPFGSSASQGT